jgi:hypothetical protein
MSLLLAEREDPRRLSGAGRLFLSFMPHRRRRSRIIFSLLKCQLLHVDEAYQGLRSAGGHLRDVELLGLHLQNHHSRCHILVPCCYHWPPTLPISRCWVSSRLQGGIYDGTDRPGAYNQVCSELHSFLRFTGRDFGGYCGIKDLGAASLFREQGA